MGQKKVATVERFKQESMYGLSAKKTGRCREVAVSGGAIPFNLLQLFPSLLPFSFFLFAPYFMPLFHVLSSLNLLMLLSWLVFIMIIFVTRLL